MLCNEYIKSLFDNSRGDFTSQAKSAGKMRKEEAFEHIFCDLSSTRFFSHWLTERCWIMWDYEKHIGNSSIMKKKVNYPTSIHSFTWVFSLPIASSLRSFFASLFKHSICNWRVLTGCEVWKVETHMNSLEKLDKLVINFEILCVQHMDIHTCCAGDSRQVMEI